MREIKCPFKNNCTILSTARDSYIPGFDDKCRLYDSVLYESVISIGLDWLNPSTGIRSNDGVVVKTKPAGYYENTEFHKVFSFIFEISDKNCVCYLK